ncbi:MAG: Smr/MutS family protein [Prevotellaceae bacterium]|jgi:DNA mismatch repair protein MutS2|nr:Smr/MutS family protein [Prevotellaceae bacterium]
MIYPSNFEQKIGFDRIRERTASLCTTTLGCEKAHSAAFLTDIKELEALLSQTQEMRTILLIEENFPDTNYVDASEFLKKLHIEGSYIEVHELVILKTALDTAAAIVTFFKHCEEEIYPYLKALTSQIVIYQAIFQRIDILLNKHGMVRDNASPELQQLRRAIHEKQTQVTRRMMAILKSAQTEGFVDVEANVAIREGRSVIPVSAVNKRKIKGLVYDESATGKTVFIEPMEVVEMNNEIRELQYAEQREIIRLLKAFTDFLRPYLEEIKATADFLGEMDFIRAKARLAASIMATKPVLRSGTFIALLEARHPLLEQALKKEGKPIVPLSLRLDTEKHILLISGPNAGGKSVCLKTVGLLQYMFQCGFLIPASGDSELGIFQNIFIDIGDEQSLENDLSTYSSHLLNMKHFLRSATADTLALIDEFGAGTEPAAGGAIAEAVLTQLAARRTFGVITTHYTNLKYYATTAPGIINGAMLFDVQQIQPLFRLETGTPGSSFAFELARKIGLPEEVVKLAEAIAGDQYVNIERNLREIARNKRYWEEKRSRIKQTDKHLEDITNKYQGELTEIQSLRKSIIKEAKEEAKCLLDEANKRIERTIFEIKEAQAEKERTKSARAQVEAMKKSLQDENQAAIDKKIIHKIEQLKQRQERRAQRQPKQANSVVKQPSEVENPPLAVGDKVRMKGQDVVGEILLMSAKKINVAFGSIITSVSPDKLERISANEFRKATHSTPTVYTAASVNLSERKLHFKPTIDVRGQRVEEAINNINYFIDEAIMVGCSEVKILHGKGTGTLKEELRKILRTIGGIKSIADEHVEMGGAGITVVIFE